MFFSDSENHESLKKICSLLKSILAVLRRSYPEEYLVHSAVQTEEIDIVVLSDEPDSIPTHEEITVKRILLDNPLLAEIKKEFLDLNKRDR